VHPNILPPCEKTFGTHCEGFAEGQAAALVVTTLAIGIAATTIVFSLADAILWHPLPFRDAGRLVRVRANLAAPGSASTAQLDPGHSIFDGVYPVQLNSAIVKVGGEPRAVTIGELSPGLLGALGIAPMWGREFASDEYVTGNAVVIVRADLWRRQQVAAQSPEDHTLIVDGVRHTIIGVMPEGFEFPVSRVALWLPYIPAPTVTRIGALGQLKAGVTIEQAQAFAQTTARRQSGWSDVRIVPFVSVNPSTATALRVLFGAVALLLLIAVANAANVIQAETVRRDAEFAIRASLGASWPRLVRQLMSEALLVSAIAAAIALVVSKWVLDALITGVPYLMSFQALRPIGIDWRALVFTAGITLFAGIGASWLSAVRAIHIDLEKALRGQGSGLPGQAQVRAVLTVAQIAVTLVPLIGAGLLGKGFLRLSAVNPGFDADRLINVNIQIPTWRYSGEAETRAAIDHLQDEVRRLPGVVDVTIAHSMPPDLQSRPLEGMVTDEVTFTAKSGFVSQGLVDGSFFTTLGIPLLSGRSFDNRDQMSTAPVAVVSRTFARQLWPAQDAIGKRFRESATTSWITVVGVVGDVPNGGFEQALGPQAFYAARTQAPTWWYEGVIVRTAFRPERIVRAFRAIVQRTMPDAPITGVNTGYDMVANVNARVRFATLLMIAFAAVALMVALIGVYGTFWSTVNQRTREIGVRMALGASPGYVLRMILAGSGRLLAIGLAVGIPLAVAGTRVLKSLLFEVSPNDPTTFAVVIAFLVAASMAATYLPAKRAAAIDPVEALRTQ
jgi:putative ABC transport system permease protein